MLKKVFNSLFAIPNDFTGIAVLPSLDLWLQNGRLHRESGPAFISYNSIIKADELKIDLDRHLYNCKDENKDILVVKYFVNGLPHRSDGPAVIYYFNDDSLNIKKFNFYLNGVSVPKDDVWVLLSDEQKEKALWNLNQWR